MIPEGKNHWRWIDLPIDEIRRKYWEEKKSIRQVADDFGVSTSVIRRRMKKFNVPTRSIPEALKGHKAWNKGKRRPEISGKNHPRYIDISKKILERMYLKEKKSYCEIAKELGVSRDIIRRRIREYKIPTRTGLEGRKPPNYIHIPKEVLEKMYVKERKGYKEIAKELNCDSSTIWKKLKEYGIPRDLR